VTVTGGYAGSPWEPQEIPNPAAPNGVIAPLWADLQLSLANDRGIRLAQSTADGVAVIQWENAFEFGGDPTDPSSSVGTFQAWVYNSVEDFRPEMTFAYGALGALPSSATIGTENILGEQATALLGAADPSAVLEEGGSICLDYEGPTFETATLGYSVTVSPGTAPGTYANTAVHVTDDPFAQPATVSASVTVDRVCTTTFTGNHVGAVTVSSGTTCFEGARQVGKVTVEPGAGLFATDSRFVGPVSASGASNVTVCGSAVAGAVDLTGSSAVRLGDPLAACAPNAVVGSVTVTGTVGPTVIAGNVITGSLACSGNDPAPVNNGEPNVVLGPKTGQCAEL
jgi:hypothetical protein